MNQIINHKNKYYLKTKNGYKEILSSTDVSLGLPQPSQQFIDKYIEEYNKGNIITDIEVEYSPSSITIQTYSEQQINDNLKALTLKINPKDNTITIKKLKDSWNREEVFAVITTFANANIEAKNVVKWLEENL